MKNKITEEQHPYQPETKIAISENLMACSEDSLCRSCIHRKTKYKDCEIAGILYDLALSTGISTLVRWCPVNHYEFCEFN